MSDVAVIIPAYNEAPRVGAVVRAALAAREVRRVLVVDDGSRDGTAGVARAAGAEILVQRNGGKAAAMNAGVRAVGNSGICFLDADLDTIRPEQIDALIEPYLRGAKMVVGLINPSQRHLWSLFAGPRVMPRAAWIWATMAEPALVGSGYGVEVILAGLANRYGWPVAEVQLDGVAFVNQAQKWSGASGRSWKLDRAARSMRMWGRVLQAGVRVGGARAWEDVWKPMLFKRGFSHRAT